MRKPVFSVVIPAANEERFVGAAIASVRTQGVPAEIIVVVNGSSDATAGVAKAAGAQVLEYEELLGSSRARNMGAQAAAGDTLLFLDADSVMGEGLLGALTQAVKSAEVGTVVGKPDNTKLRYRIFFAWKNFLHRAGLFRGVMGGVLFFDARLFKSIGGFDEELSVNELSDIIERALAAGGRYTYVREASATTSMRRFERQGFVRPLLFWVVVQLTGGSEIGRAYAASHEELYVSPHQLGHELGRALLSIRAQLALMCAGLFAAATGAVAMFAAYHGPVQFIRDLFHERLMTDPSTPFIDFLLTTVSSLGVGVLALVGLALLVGGGVLATRMVRDIRVLLSERPAFVERE